MHRWKLFSITIFICGLVSFGWGMTNAGLLNRPPATTRGVELHQGLASRLIVNRIPKVNPPPPNLEAEALADRIFLVNSSGFKTGELASAGAYKIAVAITGRCYALNFYDVGALAWVESGFRVAAVSPSGRHFGLFQVRATKVADDVEASTTEACGKLRRWRWWCREHGHTDHDFLAHWFSGTNVNARGIAAAARVRRRAKKLREAT